MTLHTASEAISLAKQLENDSAKFYQELAQLAEKDAATFLAYAQTNKKNVAQIERAYYGVITDAIEGCFAYNLEPENYVLNLDISPGAAYTELLKQAIANERTIIKYYQDAAEQSKGLMADVPRTFALIAKKREQRLAELEALAG